MKNFLSKFKIKSGDKSYKTLSSIKLKQKDKIFFLDQLGNLLNSGIPLNNALTIITLQTNDKQLKKMSEKISDDLKKGISLKDIFGQFPKVFHEFDLSILEMGEETGKLGQSVDIIREKDEKNREIRTKIIGAMIYPSVIVCLSTGMIVTFLLYIIPKVEKMYKDAKVNLPGLTQGVIDFADFLQKNIIYIAIFIGLLITGLYFFKTNLKTKIHYDKLILKIPLFGGLIRKRILTEFSSSVGVLLSSGVIINKTLEISSRVVSNDYYKKEINKIIDGVSKGLELSAMMGIGDINKKKVNPYFPIELSSIVKIGEQTGNVAKLLLKISKKFEKEIDSIVKNLQTAIEPVVIILVGGIIGTLIMAIMLPFFNMANVM